jgi:hypothetical protein
VTAELERTNGQHLAIAGKPSRTSLNLPDDLSFEDWEETGRTLGDIDRAVQWWVGDWLNFGEAHYGEKYAQAMDVTGLDYSTLANYGWVAREVESSRRRESLSFSHHAEVAALDPAKQRSWLVEAEASKWSRNKLRQEVKDDKARNPQPKEPRVCPRCNGTGKVVE